MNKYWLLWTFVSHTAKLSSALQILLVLPLTLATLSTPAFLLLSLLLSIHSIIHGTLLLFTSIPSTLLSILQLPVPFFLILVSFNTFSQSSQSSPLYAPSSSASSSAIASASTVATILWWLTKCADLWGRALKLSGPVFITMEGVSSLLVVQKLGKEGKRLVFELESEVYQFALLIATAVAYVMSAWWIVVSYPSAASSPLSATLLGVALTTFIFLTFIGFVLRRTNIVESSGLAVVIAYNIWLCGSDQPLSQAQHSTSVHPLVGSILPHLETLINFLTNTLPKPVLVALLYRLSVLQYASRILPTLGADSWEYEDGVDDGWDIRPTSTLTKLILTYRQFIFVAVYSHLLLLDQSSSVWWRWFNIFFTLLTWSVELLVSPEDDDLGVGGGMEGIGGMGGMGMGSLGGGVKEWKVE